MLELKIYSDEEMRETDAHRHACECEYLAALPLKLRRERLAGIEKRRGAKAIDRIKRTLVEMHERRKAA